MDELTIEVPADDRMKDEPDDPGRPLDLAALEALWRERDLLYAKRPTGLKDSQIETIIEYRKREANELPVKISGKLNPQRIRAWALANCWYPPEHGQGQLS